MLNPYNITLHVYAESEQEAKELEGALSDFIIDKYNQHIYPRANTLSRLIKQYGNNALVNAYLKQ